MNWLEGYRSRELCEALMSEIRQLAAQPLRFMEVCGGHTMAIRKFGIPSLLPETISLLSGPGCPVCVTGRAFIDQAIYLSGLEETVVCTFGDLIRVRGTDASLEKARAEGKQIRIVFSSLDAVELAKKNPEKKIVFLGVGFETTAPGTAAAILKANREGVKNFSVLSAHKLMPPAMEGIISEGIPIDGYICPGHVSTITGTKMYHPIVENFGIGCVVSGFEPLDLLQSILMLVKQVVKRKPKVEIQYSRAVKPEGNPEAQKIMREVFEPADEWWRGLGVLSYSGLKPNRKYREFDTREVFELPDFREIEPNGCLCGEILKGLKTPHQCVLFGKACTPSNPVGACMVSSEGACQTWYTYEGKN
ncbi:MAG: hydrogenase formation protein HypD [Bacteroidales bacterium]|nr:hydrogenase formation protein HypD [Bacteroidales bacterium]